MKFFTFDNLKKTLLEIVYTFSNKKSFFSSKRLERFSFIGLTELIITGTFLYLIYTHQLIAMDAIILTGPLLVAAGFNMKQTEKAKKEEKDETNI